MTFDYDIFFSYRHKPLDSEITQKVFNFAESYRVPAKIADNGPDRIRRAFRDKEELPVSRILTDTINRALHSCRCLVVICSTDTPHSEWVDREVETFIQLGRAEHIYPVLITGDPAVSFPPSLRLVPDIGDRVIDLRSDGNSVKAMMEKAKTGLLKVIADIFGCRETELLREDKFRRSRVFAVKAAGSAAVFAAVASVSLGLMRKAQNYRDEAFRREKASLEMIRELTYDLPDQLTNIPGAYARISDILRENTQELNRIILLSEDKNSAQYEAAVNYEKMANAACALGSYDDALMSEHTAVSIFEELTAAGVSGADMSLASAYNNRGNIYHAAGRYGEAGKDYEEAVLRLEQCGSRKETAEREAQGHILLTRMLYNSGANALSAGEDKDAETYFQMALEHLTPLEEKAGLTEMKSTLSEDAPDILEAGAQICYNYAVLLYRRGNFSETEKQLSASLERYDRLMKITDSLQVRCDRMKAASLKASVLTDQGNYAEADSWYAEAVREAEQLAENTDRVDYLSDLAQLYNNRGLSFNIRGDYTEADHWYTAAAGQYQKIYEKSRADSDGAVYAVSLLNIGENAFKMQDYVRSRRKFQEGLELYEPLCQRLGEYDEAQYYAWLSYDELIHRRDFQKALEDACKAYELQPGNILVNLNLAYACLYNEKYDECDEIFSAVAALGEGQSSIIRMDLEAQRKAGMSEKHHDEVKRIAGK